jgi:spermidine/putrescine transport system substrate-binding protein
MVIPKASKHSEDAEAFINFMCKTEEAYKNATYIWYSTPQSEVKKLLPKEVTEDKTVYPGVNDLKQSEVYEDLSSSLALYDRIWTEIKAK